MILPARTVILPSTIVRLLSKTFKHGDFGIANGEVQVISCGNRRVDDQQSRYTSQPDVKSAHERGHEADSAKDK